MAKRRTDFNEEKIARYIKEGRGQGELSSYKPWINIQDVPSKGRSHREMGWKTNRQHQLLSDLEFNYLCLCDWADNVLDIREQFPLDREITQAKAFEIGVKHPLDMTSQTPLVMTTDFLLTVREDGNIRYKARTLKYKKDLDNKRTIEKFEIERMYWESKGIDWGIVTEQEIPKVFISNLMYLRKAFNNNDDYFLEQFLSEFVGFEGVLIENLKKFDEKYNLEIGSGIMLYKIALARKYLSVNMYKKIDLKENISNIYIKKNL